jgi:hypothetical protein
MKVVIEGVTFDNPRGLRIIVAPEGETVGSWHIEMIGGPLRIEGTREHPTALCVDTTRVMSEDGLPALTFVGYMNEQESVVPGHLGPPWVTQP